MLMLAAILLPIGAGLALYLWQPFNRRVRQDYVLGAACLTTLLALFAL